MKAIVLAGGHATRLWPLTRNRAKPLLPLGGQPIVQYSMDALAGMDAVDEILVSTNARYADDFQAFIDGQGYDRARVVVEEHTEEAEKIGSLGAIMQVVEAEGADDYLVVGGDNYPTLDLGDFVAFAAEKDAVTLACHRVDSTEDATQFGVVAVDGERRVVGFQEKPAEPASRLVSTLFYYLPRHSLGLLDDYRAAFADREGDHLDEPGQLFQWGHDRAAMYAYAFDGDWHDIGTPANYLDAQARVGGSQVDGQVTRSELGDAVVVMDGAEVRDAALDRCIVFPGATITDAELDRCIVDEEAAVSGLSLSDAVVGAYSRVQ